MRRVAWSLRAPRCCIGALLIQLLGACGGSANESGDPTDGADPAAAGSTSANASDGETAADCAEPFLASDNADIQGDTQLALEIAAAAPPSTPLELMIALTDIEYDFANLVVSERQAQLAPYQDPIQTLVEERGGEVVNRPWLTNTLYVRLAAEELPGVFCWPHVENVEVSTPYWDAVPPPWDVASVGLQECPLEGAGCPVHCWSVDGERLDAARGCLVDAGAVACVRNMNPTTGDEKCRANSDTGDLFRFAGVGPLEPDFRSWRNCDDGEYERTALAARCE